MATPVRLFIDGVERTGNLDPSSIEITRELNQRQSSCSFTVYRQPVGGYYEDPSTVPGIVGWWHFDEASGNAQDASGNAGELTPTDGGGGGGVEYNLSPLAKGYGGRSVSLVNDYYWGSTASWKNLSGSQFAAWGWVKTSVGTISMPLVRRESTPDQLYVEIGHGGGGVVFGYFNARAGGTNQSSNVELPYPNDGKVHFWALTYDSAASPRVRWYLDGALVASHSDISGSINSVSDGYIQIADGSGVSGVRGFKHDEFGISSQALDAATIADLYTQGKTGADFLTVTERSEIVITNDDASLNRFGGYAVEVYQVREGAFDVGWKVRAVGWENAFESIAIERYRGVNLRTDQIISEIFAADSRLSGFNLDRVARGTVVDGVFAVRDRYVKDVLDALAEVDGDEWWIDPDGTHVYKRRANYVHTAAPRFSDEPADIDQSTVWSYRDLDYTREFRNPANRVLFRGGTIYEVHNPRNFSGTGGTGRMFHLDDKLIVPLEGDSEIVVQINEGTSVVPSWSADLVVGRFGRDLLMDDGGDKEVLLQVIPDAWDKLWFDSSKAPPYMAQVAFRVYYRQATPVRVEVVNQEAYERMGYVKFDRIVVDDSVTSVQQARSISRRLLSQQSRPLESLSLASDIDPDEAATRIRVGDLVHIANARHGLDTYEDGLRGYRVQKMCVYLYEGGTLAYSTFDLGSYRPGLMDFLKQMERDRRSILSDFDDDEQEYLELMSGWEGSDQDVNDSVAISDSVVITP